MGLAFAAVAAAVVIDFIATVLPALDWAMVRATAQDGQPGNLRVLSQHS